MNETILPDPLTATRCPKDPHSRKQHIWGIGRKCELCGADMQATYLAKAEIARARRKAAKREGVA